MAPIDRNTIDLLARLEILTEDQRAGARRPHPGKSEADLDALEAALQDRAEQTIDEPNLDDDDPAELEGIAASVEAIREERDHRPDPATLRAQLRARPRNEAPTEPV